MADANAGAAVAQPIAKDETSAGVEADLGAQAGTAGHLQHALRGRVTADDQQRIAGMVRLQDQVEDAVAIQVADEALVGRGCPGHRVQVRRRRIVERAVAGAVAQQDDILQRRQEWNRRSQLAAQHDYRRDGLQVDVRLAVTVVVAAVDADVRRTPARGGSLPGHEADRQDSDPGNPAPRHVSPQSPPPWQTCKTGGWRPSALAGEACVLAVPGMFITGPSSRNTTLVGRQRLLDRIRNFPSRVFHAGHIAPAPTFFLSSRDSQRPPSVPTLAPPAEALGLRRSFSIPEPLVRGLAAYRAGPAHRIRRNPCTFHEPACIPAATGKPLLRPERKMESGIFHDRIESGGIPAKR